MKNFSFFISLLFCFHAGFSQDFDMYDKNWATYFGGQGTRFTNSEIDSEGNIIAFAQINGGISSILQDANYYNQFITTQDSQFNYNPNLVSGSYTRQTLIAKFSPEGDLLRAVYLPYQASRTKIDANDQIYILGSSTLNNLGSPNAWFPTPHEALENDTEKTILVKLNPDFSTNWLSYIPSGFARDFSLDENNNLYGVSTTSIQTGITTPNVFQPNFMLEYDNDGDALGNGYLFKLSNDGELQWASYYGLTIPLAIAFDNQEKVIVSFLNNNSVLTQYNDYYITADAYQESATSQIVSKFNVTNGQRTYGTYLDDTMRIIHFTFHNNFIYCSGVVTDPIIDDNLISSNAYQPFYGGMIDAYLGKFTSRFYPVWGTYIGGNDFEEFPLLSKLSVSNNAIYVSGSSYSDDFINSTNTYQSTVAGSSDIFMMKFSLDGDLVWGSYFGGQSSEIYSSISVVNDSVFYLVGDTYSLENISTPESHQEEVNFHPSSNSGYNMGNGYIAKFAPEEGLSIGDVVREGNFSIYPNPTNGKVNIVGNNQTPVKYIEVFTTTGKTVLQKEISNLELHQLDLSFLAKGVYFLKVNHATSAKKLILK